MSYREKYEKALSTLREESYYLGQLTFLGTVQDEEKHRASFGAFYERYKTYLKDQLNDVESKLLLLETPPS